MTLTYLGYDLGTTRLKTGLFDEAGRRIALLSSPSPLIRTKGPDGREWIEVDFDFYWQILTDLTQSIVRDYPDHAAMVAGIGFSSQAQTFAPLDNNGRPLRNGISWLDTRAVEESAFIDALFERHVFYRMSGFNEFSPALLCSKIEWLHRHEREIDEKTWKYALLRDYLVFKMTGSLAMDSSLACLGGIANPATGGYWPEMLDRIHARQDQFACLVEPSDIVGVLSKEASQVLGLSAGIPVTTGCLDQLAAGLGTANVEPGRISENTGTCATQFATWFDHHFDSQYRMLCGHHAIPNGFFLLPYIPAAGSVIDWFLREVAPSSSLEVLTNEAAAVPAGSEGVLFAPHFAGESSPVVAPRERGHFAGLSIAHGRGHLFRAILEGIAFAIAENVAILSNLGLSIEIIESFGGAAHNPLWTQIKADCFNHPLAIPVEIEASCLGAAVLAASGGAAHVEATARRFHRIGCIVEPGPDADYYAERRTEWRRLMDYARGA